MNVIAKLRSGSALVACAIVALASSADAANFAGSWAVSGRLGNPVVATSAPVCVFRQTGSRISGSCKGPNAIGSADGSVNGRAIAWRWYTIATNEVGLSGTATYRGVWGSDGIIRGTWAHSRRPGYSGPFTAQKL
jgi:hypothetical protein